MEIVRMEFMRDDVVDIVFFDNKIEYFYTIQNLKYGNENRILEKTEEIPVGFQINGVHYYFVQNKKWNSIIWQYKDEVYIIQGKFDNVQAKTIVQSIRYEEDLH